MKINKVFKYKFVPNKTQIELLDNHFFSFLLIKLGILHYLIILKIGIMILL